MGYMLDENEFLVPHGICLALALTWNTRSCSTPVDRNTGAPAGPLWRARSSACSPIRVEIGDHPRPGPSDRAVRDMSDRADRT